MTDEYIRKQDAVNAVANTAKIVASFNYQYAIDALMALSPADVAPVKYGEWISTPEMWGAFDVRYYCSKCGKDAIINNSERYVLSNYCPHCGAIMDNKRGNENG